MKYQITCDNCGTQFVVEAGEGSTIECECPHCHSTMEVTLPLVSEGQQYTPQAEGIPNPPQKKDGNHNTILWGIVIGLLLLAIGIGAYIAFRPTPPAASTADTTLMDSIPYTAPVEDTPPPVVDTVATDPEEDAPVDESEVEEKRSSEPTDTIDVAPHEEKHQNGTSNRE